AKIGGLIRQVARGRQYEVGGAIGVLGRGGRSGNAPGDAFRSGGLVPDTPRYFVRRSVLLAHCVGDRRGEAVDLIHDRSDGADIVDRLLRRRLHLGNLGGNVLCRLGSLGGERLDFRRDYGKSATCLTGARGFDRGIERQQI